MSGIQAILAQHVRQSLRDDMPRGLYIAGGMVMCAVTGVPLLGVLVDDDGVIDDFRCSDTSSRFPYGIALPLIVVAGAAALQDHYWPDCENLLERDRERFAGMANLEHFEFEVRLARRILVAHVRDIVRAGALVAVMRLSPTFVDWNDHYLNGLREVIAGIDWSKAQENLPGIKLDS